MFTRNATKLALTALALTSPVLAQGFITTQTERKQKSYSLPYGLDLAGGTVNFTNRLERSRAFGSFRGGPLAGRFEAEARADATVRIFGWQKEAAFFGLRAYAQDADWTNYKVTSNRYATGSLTVRVAGLTLKSETTATTRSWNLPLGPYDLFTDDFATEFFVGPVPCVVRGNVGIGGAVGVGVILDAADPTAGLDASVRVYGHGHVAAGTGMGYASVGVQANLRFADTTVTAEETASYDGLGGAIGLSISPVGLMLELYAEVRFMLFGKWRTLRYSLPLFDWAMDAIEWTFDLNS